MNSHLRNQTNRFLTFKTLNPAEIQEFVGQGQNHVVFKYKNDWVVKIPKTKGATYSNHEALKSDLQLIRSYFPQLMVPTKVILNEDQTDYIVLQRYCYDCQEITSEIQHSVRRQLEDIIEQNKRLFSHTRHSLDLFGSHGFITSLLAIFVPGIKPKLSNILMKKRGMQASLFLVDTELLRLSNMSTTWLSFRSQVRSWISYKLTSFLLRRAFNFASA